MRFSKRERILMGVLFLVIIWSLFFRFLIAPGYENLMHTREFLEELEGERTQMSLNNYKELQTQLELLKDQGGEEGFFYRDIDDTFMDENLQVLAAKAGVNICRMNIGEPFNSQEAGDNAAASADRELLEAVVTMELKSPDAKSVMEFTDGIYRGDRSLVVSFVDVERDENGERQGSMEGIVEVRYYYERTK